jgi:hypothetical protein
VNHHGLRTAIGAAALDASRVADVFFQSIEE